MATAAQRAEELGFASVSVSDHTICTTGPESDGVGAVWPDWSVLSTVLALRTTRLRIVASVVIPYRPLFAQAKAVATIDQVSGGRLTLAAAVGWLRPEFEMLGLSFADRGSVTDEYLRAMKVLWTADEPRFSGRHVSFADVVFDPKCVQSPHVPIWVAGGTGRAPLRRLLELGDGWMPMGGGLDSRLRETVARVKEEAARRGRDPASLTFRYTIGIGRANASLASLSRSISVADPAAAHGSAEDVAAEIGRFEDAGFTELAINFSGTSGPEVMEQLDWFGAEVLPLVNAPAPPPETPPRRRRA
jgi:probable F420-dependent oxidoreductase